MSIDIEGIERWQRSADEDACSTEGHDIIHNLIAEVKRLRQENAELNGTLEVIARNSLPILPINPEDDRIVEDYIKSRRKG